MCAVTASQTTSVFSLGHISTKRVCRPRFSALSVLIADIAGLGFTMWLLLSTTSARHDTPVGTLVHATLLLPPFLALFWLFDLYPGVGSDPVDEFRSVSLATACGFLFVAVIFAIHHALPVSLLALPACVAGCIVILLLRTAVRMIGSRSGWWGFPVVVVGSGELAHFILRNLKSQPALGFTPVAVISDDLVDGEVANIRVFKAEHLTQIRSSGITHAIVATSVSQTEIGDAIGHAFSKVLFVPDGNPLRREEPRNLGLAGITSVQLQNNLLHAPSRLFKRTLDVVVSAIFLILLLPLIGLIAISIIVESGFPVLYFDKRLGYDGKVFHMWKFRTMAKDAAAVLSRYLEANEELRGEWTRYQKLRKDPRITRIGRLLRKTSLDEIPQLWNVLRGDMSMVGPRPRLLEVNIPKYQRVNALYGRVSPGLTGLWQVSGRNRTTYEERLAYDAYYIRNWSPWMDLYLLMRTVSVVITGYGAY
jgi:Undecaprenyl-phosphate galactose phosphotransferase WbaP